MFIEGNWHTKIIAAHAEAFRTQHDKLNYLEIGVRHATTFNAVQPFATTALAVDIDDISHNLNPGSLFANVSSDDFFTSYEGDFFDLIFIDGLHTAEQVEKDFNGSLKILNPNGAIYFHDTWPVEAAMATQNACGDVWKFVEKVEQEYAHCFTYQTFPGLTVVQPNKAPRQL